MYVMLALVQHPSSFSVIAACPQSFFTVPDKQE
jgi:hypothetical protein